VIWAGCCGWRRCSRIWITRHFVRAYQPIGRRALHPRVMLGLVVYGIINRQLSLRGLEGLARRDVGAWWVCGGHQPDHSTIGKFIQLHAEILSQEFFVELVKSLMNKLHLAPGTVAADGTVIEAAPVTIDCCAPK
jgi:transposase